VAFHIDPRSAVAGQSLADVPFPPAAGAMLLIRGRELIAARGSTVLQPGDHVYVFCRPEDRPMLQLLFGQEDRE
jgi:cell volume regulation protein A